METGQINMKAIASKTFLNQTRRRTRCAPIAMWLRQS